MYQQHKQLTELFDVLDNLNDKGHHQRDFRNLMDRAGLDKLGSGAFGTVYKHWEEDKVIKQSTQRDAYYMFARWCQEPEQVANPHLPIIHEERVYKDDDGTYCIIHVLEMLQTPIHRRRKSRHGPDYPKHCPDAAIGTLWKAGRDISRKQGWSRNEFIEAYPTKLTFIKKLLEISRKEHANEPSHWPVYMDYKLLNKYSLWVDTMYQLFSKFSNIANLDFHGGNIMLRPDENYTKRKTGTLVITDPVSEIYSSYRKDNEPGNREIDQFAKPQYTDTVTYGADMAFTMPTLNIGTTNVGFKCQETQEVKDKIKTLDRYYIEAA